ncbi:uncharacterized protein LOC135953954 [Calliphora vicina]|uniref:uncharacterized protein LOC135953954 n=1 Tax=Calliphora vicina TaxID=7373 RepID=UPI00325B1220
MSKPTSNISVKFLIHLVGERPALWDKTSEDYKDRALKETSWREICTFINENFDDMKPTARAEFTRMITRKWTHIRDSWVKSMKYGYDEVTKEPPKPYIYHNELKFMQKILKCKPPRYNLNMSQLSNMHFEEFYKDKNDTQNSDDVEHNDEEEEYLNTEHLKQEPNNSVNENKHVVINEAADMVDDEEDDWPLENTEITPMIEEKKFPVPAVKKKRMSIFKSSGNEDDSVNQPEVVRPSPYLMSNADKYAYENRHWNFFKGILPSVNGLDEDHVLQFQSGVIVLLQKLRESQKHQKKPNTKRVHSHSLFRGCGRKRRNSNDDDYDWPVCNTKVNYQNERRSTRRTTDPIAAEDMQSENESCSDN